MTQWTDYRAGEKQTLLSDQYLVYSDSIGGLVWDIRTGRISCCTLIILTLAAATRVRGAPVWIICDGFWFPVFCSASQTRIGFPNILVSLRFLQVVYQIGFKFPKSGPCDLEGFRGSILASNQSDLISGLFKATNCIKFYIVPRCFVLNYRRQMMIWYRGETWYMLTHHREENLASVLLTLHILRWRREDLRPPLQQAPHTSAERLSTYFNICHWSQMRCMKTTARCLAPGST